MPPASWFSKTDLHLFNEGNYVRAYEKMGAHPMEKKGVAGTHFAVWAPSARNVSVVGNFNNWKPGKDPLKLVQQSGIWEGFVPGTEKGQTYKYHIDGANNYVGEKTDPYAVHCEIAPKTASVIWDLDYEWNDAAYLAKRKAMQCNSAPVSIYEVHLGSWMRVPEDNSRSLSYREMAPRLTEHVKNLGFTHIELMPITEHPYYPSWGYQTTGYFAATSRYGTPQDLMYLIDYLHQNDIGVILDWVPSHFATDGHGLTYFDGTHLYEHADRKQGFHPDWGSYVFNYSRHEVRSFLLSSALFWLDKYHIDGIRVDAVASMLYLDYSRKEGDWVPNQYGGRENIDAIHFLRRLNESVYAAFPDVQTYAEESTSWPMVSRPTYVGGLGFGYKWDMGWMHDSLRYCLQDPINRKYHHQDLTFRMLYAYSENFALPLSHDEVVHGKGPLFDKMAGGETSKYAGLRLLFAYQWGMTGKKLLFMGGEFGQRSEWKHDKSLDWHLLDDPRHAGVMKVVGDLNRLYQSEPALHELDNQPGGFDWVDCSDYNASIISFLRRGKKIQVATPVIEATDAVAKTEPEYIDGDVILCVLNFTPVTRDNYRIGVPYPGYWREILNTDAACYGGGNVGNNGGVHAEFHACHGQPYSVVLTLPPMGALYLKGHA
ncbi:1,4-alpha-glucan branching protein GlgB [soil metagenome]